MDVMIGISIRQRKGPGERWQSLVDVTVDLAAPVQLHPVEAAESDQWAAYFVPLSGRVPDLRLLVGDVLVASSLPTDRVALIADDPDTEAELPAFVCRGRLLADWAGLTEVVIQARSAGAAEWSTVLTLPIAVSAGKLATEQFDQLFAELERDAAAVLLDVHGKTHLGLKESALPASSAPAAVLSRLRETTRELGQVLHQLARQPASRLRPTLSREQALVGQAVSEETLAEACRDPGLLGRVGPRLAFREHIREHSRPDYRIPEHQALADFLEYLKVQLADLRQRLDLEIGERSERKRWRNYVREAGKPTWWEAEDLPRIEELGRCRQDVTRLRALLDAWCGLPFLPPGRCLRQRPQSTPLFRNHPLYRRAFRVMLSHFLAYRATLDPQPLLIRARSLPVLYEWWCAVRVIRVLARGLSPLAHDPLNRPILSTRLAQEGKRFTIEFLPDQALSFTDGRGARVRFRYQPQYPAVRESGGPSVGVLDANAVRTPDMAIEVFRARSATPGIPDLIIVVDAKYSSATQAEKMVEVTTKYAKIGDGRTGRVLSRQVWALTPAASVEGASGEGLRRFCTVDNVAFWFGAFDPDSSVNGAVQTRPIAPGAFDPLQALLSLVLRLAGVEYTDTQTS